jgi:hypothetical protein
VIVLAVVEVIANEVIPVTLIVFVADIIRLPVTDNVNAPVNVTFWSTLAKLRDKQVAAAPSVTVNDVLATPSDAASKNTSSAVVGTDAPEAPPEAVDQLAVDPQVPEPPTQNLLAIIHLCQ